MASCAHALSVPSKDNRGQRERFLAEEYFSAGRRLDSIDQSRRRWSGSRLTVQGRNSLPSVRSCGTSFATWRCPGSNNPTKGTRHVRPPLRPRSRPPLRPRSKSSCNPLRQQGVDRRCQLGLGRRDRCHPRRGRHRGVQLSGQHDGIQSARHHHRPIDARAGISAARIRTASFCSKAGRARHAGGSRAAPLSGGIPTKPVGAPAL